MRIGREMSMPSRCALGDLRRAVPLAAEQLLQEIRAQAALGVKLDDVAHDLDGQREGRLLDGQVIALGERAALLKNEQVPAVLP
jgi:hypothetical protein